MKHLLQILLPALIGLSSIGRADNIDDLVAHAMKQQNIPGLTLAVLRDGHPIKLKAYGLANIDYNVPTKVDTPFLLASMTKSFTATSIMMLVEGGKIELDSPISTYLPDTPESWKGITVRHLLSHTAGLKDRFEEVPYDTTKWKLVYPEAVMYKASRETAVDFPPGEHFQYSDQGFFLLGMIVEKVSGMSYPAFLKKRIFEPLGMKNTTTVQLPKIIKGMATGYVLAGGTLYHNSRRTDYGMVSHFGMISTVDDLAKWDAALYGEKLLKHASLEQMWTPAKLNNGSADYCQYGGYGLGWFIDAFNGHTSVGHGGSTGTAYLHLQEDKLTVIVLTNLEQITGGDATGIATEIARTYIPGLRWSAFTTAVDPQPELGKIVKSVFDDLEAGKMDDTLFEPWFGKNLKPSLSAQKQELSSLGPLKSVDYLEQHPWGSGRIVRYRTNFQAGPFFASLWFDPQGRIAFIELEPEARYK